jgi:hypothetical protein
MSCPKRRFATKRLAEHRDVTASFQRNVMLASTSTFSGADFGQGQPFFQDVLFRRNGGLMSDLCSRCKERPRREYHRWCYECMRAYQRERIRRVEEDARRYRKLAPRLQQLAPQLSQLGDLIGTK